jgi:hypothetical protein
MPETGVQLFDAQQAAEQARMIKSAEEIGLSAIGNGSLVETACGIEG